jgi:hypothetical protein
MDGWMDKSMDGWMGIVCVDLVYIYICRIWSHDI